MTRRPVSDTKSVVSAAIVMVVLLVGVFILKRPRQVAPSTRQPDSTGFVTKEPVRRVGHTDEKGVWGTVCGGLVREAENQVAPLCAGRSSASDANSGVPLINLTQ